MLALLHPALLPFSAALALLLALTLLQLVGLDSHVPDSAHDVGGALDWLNAGRLPLLILAILFLALFAISGFVVQFVAHSLLGWLPWPIATAAATVAALPLVRRCSRPLARLLPLDETTAVDIESLVGRRARIVLGTAAAGSPARAEVIDAHGQRHFVMVEPAGTVLLTPAELLLLVSRDGPHFRAVAIPDDVFSEMKV